MENGKLAISFLLFSTLLSLFHPFAAAEPSKNISAVFAFGDSTLDAGNNNDLPTLVRADHPPYGRDFPSRVPTGRFTNGKLITDFLVSALGLRDVLPTHSDRSLTMANLTTGASFASGGSGLDDLTATTSSVTTIGRQVANFEAYIWRLHAALGNDEASRIIRDAMFVIGAGSNDMIMNYYMLPARRMTFTTVSSYHTFLLSQLRKLVSYICLTNRNLMQQLYSVGARKFAIAGLPPLGCLPLQVTLETMRSSPPTLQRTCINQQNIDSMAYNALLQASIRTWNNTLPNSKFVYVDIYNPLMDMVTHPLKYGRIAS
ncbi:GDSL esterase/lipase At2g40250 [Phoenix dactylifera]|uniref:GDSL esterase/lipase At2g40250 n=1 Tax=Phoenix dactylifera TaxID=42345 RepID=A0A8B9AYU6_PHODC|nr:GDSL esterase/lipase At2g40250 [Phoenix dactylifera]